MMSLMNMVTADPELSLNKNCETSFYCSVTEHEANEYLDLVL